MTEPRFSPRKRLLFVAVATAFTVLFAFVALLAVDVYLHTRFQKSAGVNIWGYRGPTVGRKRSDEFRIALLGGSSAFGYGVSWQESMPAVLEQKLTRTTRRYTVVNLAYNNEGAYSFLFTLKDFAYLNYDLVCSSLGHAKARSFLRCLNPLITDRGSDVKPRAGLSPI